MKQLFFLYIFLAFSFTSFASGIDGKWQPYDMSITIEGVPSAISTAIAQQMKSDPSTECVRKSTIEVKKNNTYSFTNACDQNGSMSGTWKLNGDKLSFTLSKYPDVTETAIVKSITADTIVIDITGIIPKEFEFNGIKPTSLILTLKKM